MANKIDQLWNKKYAPLRRSIDYRTRRIQQILFTALAAPERSNAFWAKVNKDITEQYKIINVLQSKWNETNIPIAYRAGLIQNQKRADLVKRKTNQAKKTIKQLMASNATTQTVTALYTDAINSISSGLINGQKNVIRLTKMTQQALLTEATIDLSVAQAYEAGNISINKIYKNNGTLANQLLQNSKDGKFISVNGRNYKINSYAELVTRTKWHEAQAQAAITQAANYKTDLIKVSTHNTTTVICQQYEGKIYSISGKNKDFPSLGEAPPFHPNCLHYLTVVFEEVLKLTNQYDDMSAWSKGDSATNPTAGFVPIKDRDAIVAEVDKLAKGALNATEKRALINTEIGNAAKFLQRAS